MIVQELIEVLEKHPFPDSTVQIWAKGLSRPVNVDSVRSDLVDKAVPLILINTKKQTTLADSEI